MTHLSVLIDSKRVFITQLTPSAGGFNISRLESIHAPAHLYQDILGQGNPKQLAECSKLLADKLRAYPQTDVSVCLNLTGVKSLVACFNRNLNELEFQEECAHEAEAFLRDCDEFDIETVQFADEPNLPFEKHLLFFVPKRFLTRLQMLLLPSGKNIVLVELSHVAIQSLYAAMPELVVLELSEAYLSISKLIRGAPVLFRYWALETETDMAYFVTNELKALGGNSPVSLFGSFTSQNLLGFIQEATGFVVQPALLPDGFSVQPAWKEELPLILPLFGCAMKVTEFAE